MQHRSCELFNHLGLESSNHKSSNHKPSSAQLCTQILTWILRCAVPCHALPCPCRAIQHGICHMVWYGMVSGSTTAHKRPIETTNKRASSLRTSRATLASQPTQTIHLCANSRPKGLIKAFPVFMVGGYLCVWVAQDLQLYHIIPLLNCPSFTLPNLSIYLSNCIVCET